MNSQLIEFQGDDSDGFARALRGLDGYTVTVYFDTSDSNDESIEEVTVQGCIVGPYGIVEELRLVDTYSLHEYTVEPHRISRIVVL